MKYVFIMILISFSVSCVTTQKIFDKDLDELSVDMATFNKRMGSYFYKEVIKKNPADFTKKVYLDALSTKFNPSEKEYANFVKENNPEVAIHVAQINYAVCLKSLKKEIVLCDCSKTDKLDYSSYDTKVEIMEKVKVVCE